VNQPDGLAFDTVTGWLYVANFGNSTVTVYDQSGNAQNRFGQLQRPQPPHGDHVRVCQRRLVRRKSRRRRDLAFADSGTASTKFGASFTSAGPPQGLANVP
jgi:hypothetical protein